MADKVIPTDIPSKANPTTSDILIISDVSDNNELKQITIWDITTDIGSGLIVDASASTTTTYSSDKINTLNGTQDTNLTNWLALKVNKAGDTLTGRLEQAKGTDIASATATPLGTATGNYVDITWVTTITSFTTATAGTQIKVRFVGALILTHNATSLILPTGANITTIANDTAEFVSLWGGNWKCLWYTRASWAGLVPFDVTTLISGQTEDTAGDMSADFLLAYDTSAGANRKQKPQVYTASDAEATAWTVTTKWMTPKNVKDNYWLNTYTTAWLLTLSVAANQPKTYSSAVQLTKNWFTTFKMVIAAGTSGNPQPAWVAVSDDGSSYTDLQLSAPSTWTETTIWTIPIRKYYKFWWDTAWNQWESVTITEILRTI